ICALLTGCDRYIALDVVRYASVATNLRVFDELLELLRAAAPIPATPSEPTVRASDFPIEPVEIRRALEPRRVASIRMAVAADALEYAVPWDDSSAVEAGSADLVISQAVMEHVTDPLHTYRSIRSWLKPGGMTAHQIDFGSHSRAPLWNGHWAYPDSIWKAIEGRRSSINRIPLSGQLAAIESAGLRLLRVDEYPSQTPSVPRSSLAARWSNLSDTDLLCRSAYVQAQAPPTTLDRETS